MLFRSNIEPRRDEDKGTESPFKAAKHMFDASGSSLTVKLRKISVVAQPFAVPVRTWDNSTK
jgi:hypothetical protein